MDQVFSKENKTLKKYCKIGKKYWKSQGKVREFCQSTKVGPWVGIRAMTGVRGMTGMRGMTGTKGTITSLSLILRSYTHYGCLIVSEL